MISVATFNSRTPPIKSRKMLITVSLLGEEPVAINSSRSSRQACKPCNNCSLVFTGVCAANLAGRAAVLSADPRVTTVFNVFSRSAPSVLSIFTKYYNSLPSTMWQIS